MMLLMFRFSVPVSSTETSLHAEASLPDSDFSSLECEGLEDFLAAQSVQVRSLHSCTLRYLEQQPQAVYH